MNENIQTVFSNSELALASYASLSNGLTKTESNVKALEGAGLSATQAEEFAARYPTVVAQFNDTEGGMDTSFSATIFADTSGNLTLAIRGTLEAGDFLPTDSHIALNGAGYDQIVAMYNWWNKVSTSAGQVQQYAIRGYPEGINPVPIAAGFYLVETSSAAATGELSAGNQPLSVVGHSLGGHLAMAFGAIFPTATADVTVFNAPGFISSQNNAAFFAQLGGAVPTGTDTINVIADEAQVGDTPWNGIAGLHSRPGVDIDAAIENQWLSDEPHPTSARNHSQQTLTDALAVYAVLHKLDPTLTPETFKTILGSAAIGTAGSLESIIDGLEGVFGVNATPLSTGNSNRDALYQAIYGLPDDGLTYQIKPLAGLPAGDITDAAQSDIAYRYALVHLNSFVITGNETLYADHNQNQELNIYNPSDEEGKEGHLTDQYLKDRAEFLALKNQLSTQDDMGTGTHFYSDHASGDFFRSESGTASGTITFGTSEGETLSGSSRDDQLYGGADSDTLGGLGGNDYLEGGKGHDTYKVTDGDELLDIDGWGQVVDLYNFWQSSITPEGETYDAARLTVTLDSDSHITTSRYNYNIEPVDSSLLSNTKLQAGSGVLSSSLTSIDVNGHSLGGHLVH